MTLLVSVYKAKRKEGLYIYVTKQFGFKKAPAELLEVFGPPVYVMDLLLTEKKRLARAVVTDVIAQIETKGYFIQMPPGDDESIFSVISSSSKNPSSASVTAGKEILEENTSETTECHA